MAKGRFRHPIGMKLSELNIPYGEKSFIGKIPAYDRFANRVGDIAIAYFGYIEKGIFYVVSYSYSLDGFGQHIKETYNTNPVKTAMEGLNTVGIPLRGL